MTPIQQLYLGLGASKKTYMDDVFSTYLWKGTGNSNTTITNNIDLSSDGGLVWIKNRGSAYGHGFFDTVRGVTKQIKSDSNAAESTESNTLTTFLNNGFKVNSDVLVNQTNEKISSWSFKETKGFFDIVTYTGNGSNRTIAHSLGSVPGMILIKCTSASDNWRVYHRSITATDRLILNSNSAAIGDVGSFNNTEPTASVFSVGTSDAVNNNGETYVAYLFAGGESTAATAKSCPFDGNNDCLTIASTSDFSFGTGDFTIEFWAKPDAMGSSPYFMDFRTDGSDTGTTNQPLIYISSSSGTVSYWLNGSTRISTSNKAVRGSWAHYAIVRNSGTTTLYMNGSSQNTYSDSTNYPNSPLTIAKRQNGGQLFDGKISNLRIVKGTAVYTSSFRPPTEPLTNISGTVLLCCNNSSATTATVTPGTITGGGGLSSGSDDSPFDDPAAFKFGENKDEGIIKCGQYIGNSSTSGPEIHLGWEPQWILLKNTGGTTSWRVYDSMRGIVTGGDDELVHPDSNGAAYSGNTNEIDLTSTGFKLVMNDDGTNQDGKVYSYMAIRRPDGYVGKPADAGTDVFAMDTGAGSSTIPNFDSGFPVDFALNKWTSTTSDWYAGARLLQGKRLEPNTIDGEATAARWVFDSNTGWNDFSTFDSGQQSWMWKRHAGFDVVTYAGNAVAGRAIPHGLSKAPEMIWIKARGGSVQWCIGHKGRNGGVNPWNYFSAMNGDGADEDNAIAFNDTAPTSTHFTVGGADATANQTSYTYVAMLFASVDKISKCGFYDGSASDQTITTGFQPRFVIIKCTSDAGDWCIWDTTRGWASGNDSRLVLNSTGAANTSVDVGNPTSTGFVVGGSQNTWNMNGRKYIYYAHA